MYPVSFFGVEEVSIANLIGLNEVFTSFVNAVHCLELEVVKDEFNYQKVNIYENTGLSIRDLSLYFRETTCYTIEILQKHTPVCVTEVSSVFVIASFF